MPMGFMANEQYNRRMTHGGDRYRNHVELDFSINVNPFGMPASVKDALLQAIDETEFYPDIHYETLHKALADTYGKKMDQIVCGNGASELLMAIVHAFQPENVLLPVPSFSGYQWVLNVEKISAEYVFSSFNGIDKHNDICLEIESGDETQNKKNVLERITAETDMIFLTNPNNPTGRYWDSDLLEAVCNRCEETGTIVVMDECFMELSDAPSEHSLISKMERWKNLLILRAFTKSFAIPGIRLGYLLGADEKKIDKIARHLPEWNLSTMAQKAGVACLKEVETGYLEQSRQYIGRERTFLQTELQKLGFEVNESVTNFMLIRWAMVEDSVEVGNFMYQKLLEKGILIRDCSDYQGLEPGMYRIAVRNHEENMRFLEQMKQICDERK